MSGSGIFFHTCMKVKYTVVQKKDKKYVSKVGAQNNLRYEFKVNLSLVKTYTIKDFKIFNL